MPLGLESQGLAYLLKGSPHLPERLTNLGMLRSGFARRSVQRSAWVLGTPTGVPRLAETTSTERSSLPYQSPSVMVLQRVKESSPMTERYGSPSPLRRGLSIWPGQRSGTGSYLKFDLSTIPTGSKISSASVTLNVTNSSTETYQAYELKRPWAESAATWLLYATRNSWQIAGATGSLDRGTTVAGNVSPSTIGKQTFALSPDVVQSWVNNPASNNGIVIENTTNTDGFDFSSREATLQSNSPQITVTYSVP
jgi:hypothetical protein